MNLKPQFLTRLSNLIIIQVIFVFSALALILFYSQKEDASTRIMFSDTSRINGFADRLVALLPHETTSPDDSRMFRISTGELASLFRSDESVLHVEIFVQSQNGEISKRAEYAPFKSDLGDHLMADESLPPIDMSMIDYVMNHNDSTLQRMFYGAEFTTAYTLRKNADNVPLLLVTISKHDYLISNRSYLRYAIFLLFLVSTLISLLTAYMITNRLREPLKKLTYGLEKTAQGEMYHMVEPRGDRVIRELAASFNDMSKRLWVDNQKLKSSNNRFEESNRLLADSQNFLSTLIDNSPDCVISTGVDGLIKVFNQQASDLFNIPNEEIIGRHVSELFTQALPAELDNNEAAENAFKGVELLGRRRQGSPFPVYLVSSAIRSGNYGIIGYLYIVRDISESRSFQEMMVRIDRFCTKGEMAGDIAHEINNYLSVLSGNLELLPGLLEQRDSEKLEEKLQIMSTTMGKIERFANGLMDQNHGEADFELTDLNQLVENVVAFLKPQNRFSSIEFKSELSTELPPIRVDASQIQQLLVNLIYNSSEAMDSQSGIKRISIRTLPGKSDSIGTVRIEVQDNGPGVPQKALPSLFKTRFSTKREGHGIGLVSCQRIVEIHDGKISYQYHQGAKFSIELPLSEGQRSSISDDVPGNSLIVDPV